MYRIRDVKLKAFCPIDENDSERGSTTKNNMEDGNNDGAFLFVKFKNNGKQIKKNKSKFK